MTGLTDVRSAPSRPQGRGKAHAPIRFGGLLDTFPEQAGAEAAFWEALTSIRRTRFAAGEERLGADSLGPAVIQARAQAVASAGGTLVPLAAPRYTARGCAGAFIRAAILIRTSAPAQDLTELRGGVAAIPHGDSDALALFRAEAAVAGLNGPAPWRILRPPTTEAALRALIEGESDIAAIDAVSWARLQSWRPGIASEARLLRWTTRCPAPPIAAISLLAPATVTAMRRRLLRLGEDEAVRPALRTLGIEGFEAVSAAQYRAVVHLDQFARSLGYSEPS